MPNESYEFTEPEIKIMLAAPARNRMVRKNDKDDKIPPELWVFVPGSHDGYVASDAAGTNRFVVERLVFNVMSGGQQAFKPKTVLNASSIHVDHGVRNGYASCCVSDSRYQPDFPLNGAFGPACCWGIKF